MLCSSVSRRIGSGKVHPPCRIARLILQLPAGLFFASGVLDSDFRRLNGRFMPCHNVRGGVRLVLMSLRSGL